MNEAVYNPVRALRSQGADLLNVPIIRSMYTEGAFSYCGLADARSITSMPGFKIRLKTQAYTQQLCVCVFLSFAVFAALRHCKPAEVLCLNLLR